MARTAREQEYITQARAFAKQIFEGIMGLQAMQPEWQAKNYAANLDDGIGENAGIIAADIGAVVFGTADAMKDLLDNGHATNLTALL